MGGTSYGIFGDIFIGYLSVVQDIATVVLIFVTVLLGLKLGRSSLADDSRSRTEAIAGLFFVIVGEVVVIHAQSIVMEIIRIAYSAG